MPGRDPIIEAWQGAFPDLFEDFEAMPAELRDHLRYPHDLFTVQTNMWASYQVTEPEALIIGTEKWAVAQDPGRSVAAGNTAETVVDETGVVSSRERRVSAYYSLIQLPGEEDVSYVILRSFVPVSDDDSRKELTAFMVAETRPDGSSRLVSYEMSNLLAPGPAIVASNISTNPEISARLTLLNDQGSSVDFGDLLLLPVDDSVLYVRSLYVRAQGTQIPLLAGVIAAVGDRTALADTFEEALEALYPNEDFSDIILPPAADLGSQPGPDPAPAPDPETDPAPDGEQPDPGRFRRGRPRRPAAGAPSPAGRDLGLDRGPDRPDPRAARPARRPGERRRARARIGRLRPRQPDSGPGGPRPKKRVEEAGSGLRPSEPEASGLGDRRFSLGRRPPTGGGRPRPRARSPRPPAAASGGRRGP